MKTAFGLAALLAVSTGCASAVQHPVPTFTIVGAGFGFGTCEMAGVGVGTCGIVGGAVGLGLGAITALVYLLTDQDTPQMAGEEVPPEERARPRHHAPIILPPPAEEAAGSGSDVPATPAMPPVLALPPVDAGIAPIDAP